MSILLYKWLKWKWVFLPELKGFLFRLLFSGKRVKIGNNFKCDTWPELLITDEGCLTIGDDVVFKRNVELRVHKKATIIIGSKVKIDRGVRLLTTNNSTLSIGNRTRVGLYTVVNGGDDVKIGEKCLISGYVYIQTSNHRFKKNNVSIQNQGYDHAPIVIHNDVWIAAHVIILPGIEIGKSSIAGAGAVINKNVEPDTLVGGIPAKRLKTRN